MAEAIATTTIHLADVRDRVPGEYVGRRMPGRPGSPLGNPFKVAQHGTAAALNLYRLWLRDALEEPGSAQRTEIDRLLAILRARGSLTLLCWCKGSETCHAAIIRDALMRRMGDRNG